MAWRLLRITGRTDLDLDPVTDSIVAHPGEYTCSIKNPPKAFRSSKPASSLSLVALATAVCALTQCHVTYALKAEKGRGRENIRLLEEVSIVDVRGECAAIEAGSTCNEVLNAISLPNDRLVWVPVEAELSNGTIVELGRDWLIRVEERKLAQHDPLRSFLGDTCHVVIFNGVCLNTYHGCVEIDGRAYPRPSFWSLLKAPTLDFLTQETVKTENTLVPPSYAGLRSYPPPTFQVGDPAVTATCRPDVAGITGSNENLFENIPRCGYYKGASETDYQWTTYETSVVDALENGYYFPSAYEGLRMYQSESFEVGSPPVSISCREDAIAMSNISATTTTCVEGVTCEGSLVYTTDDLGCEVCGVSCPIASVDISEVLSRIEWFSALIALPMLVILCIRTTRTWRKTRRRPDGLLALCSLQGLLYALLMVVVLATGQTGCPSSGLLRAPYGSYNSTETSQFWSETHTQAVFCTLTLPSIHLLQSMYGSLTTFVVLTYENVQRALMFRRVARWSWSSPQTIIGAVFIVLIPLVASVLSSTLGKFNSRSMTDNPRFQLDLVRQLYFCSPSYESEWAEVLVAEGVFALTSGVCITYARDAYAFAAAAAARRQGNNHDLGHTRTVMVHCPRPEDEDLTSVDSGHFRSKDLHEKSSFDAESDDDATEPKAQIRDHQHNQGGLARQCMTRRKRILAVIIILVIVLAVGVAVFVSNQGSSEESSSGVASDGDEASLDQEDETLSPSPSPITTPTPGPTVDLSPVGAVPTDSPSLVRDFDVDRSLDAEGKPYWDWDWVQIWTQRGRRASTISESDLDFMETYPVAMYVVSKSVEQEVDPEYVHCLEKMTSVFASLKAKVPSLPVLSYLNSALNFPMLDRVWCPLQNVENASLPNVSLDISKPRYGCEISSDGIISRTSSVAEETDVPLFDLRNDQVVRTMIDFANASANVGFQGIFLDRADINCATKRVCKPSWIPATFASEAEALRWDAAHDAMMQEIQSEIFPSAIVVGNNRNVPGLSARQHEKFGIEEYHLKPSEALESFMEGARSGKVMQAFANPCSIDEATINFSYGDQLVSGRFMRINTLAMFLIGMCRYSYYSCALGFIADNAWNERQPNNADLNLSDEELWAGNVFYPEYSYNLGEPQGYALEEHLDDGQSLYYREFKSTLRGNTTRVWLHIKSERVRNDASGTYDIRSVIEWADGNISSSSDSVNGSSIRASFEDLFPSYLETSPVQNETCVSGIA
ncbi:Hypothetical Protein FCC1311_007442 [Hondaea fermentalgiana]|uniref:Uncharacterized protein n=1 Tax=Hondaea fermentalgiana TaxID=2315210 RepID=A0A2R5G1W1_9STRA|nr:Hypothetical Protein FCC1311_007442 [Hondaea fermentalgiana]|eukprot:GBG24525.1 Hypothetical Protein FCC1311_007442 [Hondaea fermentalgiana]